MWIRGTALAVVALAIWCAWDFGEVPAAGATTTVRERLVRHRRVPPAEPPAFGDLDAVRSRGVLRVLVERGPGGLALTSTERALVQQFAEGQGLEPRWSGRAAGDLYRGLQNGLGDMVVGGPGKAAAGIRRTLAWGDSRRQVLARADTGRIRRETDLTTRQIAVRRSSPAWDRLNTLARTHRTMAIIEIPEESDTADVLAGVTSGRYDVAVADSILLQGRLADFPDVEVAYDLTEDEGRSWAVREEAVALLGALNRFLNRKHLELEMARVYRADLPELLDRKVLRLITYQSPVNYYLDRGRLRGFEYELVRRFAQHHHIRLDVVIAQSHEEMRSLLLNGRGDLVAASLPLGSFGPDEPVSYTAPVNYAAPTIVGRADATPIGGVHELVGRRVVLPPESPYRPALERLQEEVGIDLQIIEAEPPVNTEGTLFRVAQGLYDLTVIGSHQVGGELARQLNLKAHFSLAEAGPLVWGLRRSDARLRAALNEFIRTEFRRGFYNMIYARYVENPGPGRGDPRLLGPAEPLSPYDDIVHRYAERYDFDWRLIVAQMFQESRFRPDALSAAGAMGLMQMLPETASHLGVADPADPQASIHGGIRYLDYLRGQFEDDLLLEDRTWFTLAAYNAGLGRVKRARRLAEEMDLDGDRWFDNVERAMLAMGRPYYRDGEIVQDCRCAQAVVYVRDIRTRYNNYVRLTSSTRSAATLPVSQSRI